jgi:hypothetical protein
MPVKLGKKSYKSFDDAKKSVKKKKGLSDERASRYVAAVERAQGKDPRTGKTIKKRKTSTQIKGKKKKSVNKGRK